MLSNNSVGVCRNTNTIPNAENAASIAFLSANVLLSSIVLVYEQENEEHHDRISKDTVSTDQCESSSSVCDCSDIRSMGITTNGVYRLYVVHEQNKYYKKAFCEFTNGCWTIFQRRKDGSEDFYRGWNDYKDGFGNISGEFWLGNDFIHLLTSKRKYRLIIDLEDFDGQKRYAEYSTFNISSAADNYRLSIENYSGNAGDSLGNQSDHTLNHNGRQFSTKDADNDLSPSNCALDYRGGWWYNHCHQSNLNGIYKRGNYSSSGCKFCGIEWDHWRGRLYSLKTTEMKITPVV